MLVSPSGSVELNSPITVPIAEFSAMVRLLALISVGAEFAERTHGNRHSETIINKRIKNKLVGARADAFKLFIEDS